MAIFSVEQFVTKSRKLYPFTAKLMTVNAIVKRSHETKEVILPVVLLRKNVLLLPGTAVFIFALFVVVYTLHTSSETRPTNLKNCRNKVGCDVYSLLRASFGNRNKRNKQRFLLYHTGIDRWRHESCTGIRIRDSTYVGSRKGPINLYIPQHTLSNCTEHDPSIFRPG